jgi:hypothetical protein
MPLVRDGPPVVPFLDQAEFLQPLAKKQRDRSTFGNPAKGHLFVIGKFGLLDAARREFHQVPFWRLLPARPPHKVVAH